MTQKEDILYLLRDGQFHSIQEIKTKVSNHASDEIRDLRQRGTPIEKVQEGNRVRYRLIKTEPIGITQKTPKIAIPKLVSWNEIEAHRNEIRRIVFGTKQP